MPVALLLNAYADCIDNSIGVLVIVVASSANALRTVPSSHQKISKISYKKVDKIPLTLFC